jgi:hypothetical protein
MFFREWKPGNRETEDCNLSRMLSLNSLEDLNLSEVVSVDVFVAGLLVGCQ